MAMQSDTSAQTGLESPNSGTTLYEIAGQGAQHQAFVIAGQMEMGQEIHRGTVAQDRRHLAARPGEQAQQLL
jgi:hypothetical protein